MAVTHVFQEYFLGKDESETWNQRHFQAAVVGGTERAVSHLQFREKQLQCVFILVYADPHDFDMRRVRAVLFKCLASYRQLGNITGEKTAFRKKPHHPN